MSVISCAFSLFFQSYRRLIFVLKLLIWLLRKLWEALEFSHLVREPGLFHLVFAHLLFNSLLRIGRTHIVVQILEKISNALDLL